MTSSDPGQRGSAWLPIQQQVARSFLATFDFRISNPGGIVNSDGRTGADGFAFVIQNDSPSDLGAGGGGLGYDGIPDSLAVEFDTWWNPEFGDPNGNHISVHTGGTGPNSVFESFSLGLATAIPDLKDGKGHHVEISYQPGLLQVFVDNLTAPVLRVPVDLSQILSLDDGSAWVGFTGATGAAYENHEIQSFNFLPS